MNRFIATIIFSFLLISCASAKEKRSLGEYEDLWPDFKGNVLPIELESIELKSTIKVTGEYIESMEFVSPTELIGITSEGVVFLIDVKTEGYRIVRELGKIGAWYLKIHNSDEFMAFGYTIEHSANEYRQQEYYEIECFRKNGDSIWSKRHFELPSGTYTQILFDGKNYFLIDQGLNGIVDIYELSNEGDLILYQEDIGDVTSYYFKFTIGRDLYFMTSRIGPYFCKGEDNGFPKLELWNENWDSGLTRPFIDSKNGLLGFRVSPVNIGDLDEKYELIILPSRSERPLILDFIDELGLDYFDFREEWGANNLICSDGDFTALGYTHHLLKYVDGRVSIWQQNLDKYMNKSNDVFYMNSLNVDKFYGNFIVSTSSGLIYGNEEFHSVDGTMNGIGKLHFATDYKFAAAAGGDGEVAIFEIHHKNEI